MIKVTIRRLTLYSLLFACLCYGASPLMAGELGAATCCKFEGDCGADTSVVCCAATSPEGCSADKKLRCLNGCDGGCDNYYCPGSPECLNPQPCAAQ